MEITTDIIVRLNIMKASKIINTLFLRAPPKTFNGYNTEGAAELFEYSKEFCNTNFKSGKQVNIEVKSHGVAIISETITII